MQFIDSVMGLPLFAGIAVLVGLTTGSGLAVYVLTHRLLAQSQPKDIRRAADYLFRAVGILVSLFLSLTFADVVLELNQIEASIEREAVIIEDIYYDLGQYGTPRAERAQEQVVDYLQSVIEHDWPALANDRLSRKARDVLHQLETEVLHLEDHSELQGILRSRIISDVDAVSALRLNRVEQALAKPPLFLTVVVFGFLVSMVCFGPHRPTRLTLTLLSFYTVFIGLVIYLILAYSDPFQGATGIEPTSLNFVFEQIRPGAGQ